MTTPAVFVLAFAGLCAVADWIAVARQDKRLEYLAKPATLVALIVVALLLEPADPTQRAWWVAALAFSLAGDVFLMLPGRFVAGLASFLVGHLAYIAGFWLGPVAGSGPVELAVALLVPGLAAAALGPRILAGARAQDARLTLPVANYLAVIGAMVGSALLTRQPLAIAGALLFFASDSMIGWRNFVERKTWQDLAIITTYHLGQALLVLSLLH
jgi:uncharacterized membrane protein YhhN